LVEGGVATCALAKALLLLLQPMEQVDDDVADTRQKVVEAGLRSFLAECFLENAAQQLGDIAKILGVDADGVEGARGDVEFIS
jgi:hypothetical protein